MKLREFLALILIIGWFGVIPAAAHDCCHHGHHCDDSSDCSHNCDRGTTANNPSRYATPSSMAADLQTAEGKITEINYLPGTTPDSGMVEIRLQSAKQSLLIRLAPVGFLKQGGLRLREGDTVVVKGFPVAAMEGDLLVATELQKGDKTLPLRDARGREAW